MAVILLAAVLLPLLVYLYTVTAEQSVTLAPAQPLASLTVTNQSGTIIVWNTGGTAVTFTNVVYANGTVAPLYNATLVTPTGQLTTGRPTLPPGWGIIVPPDAAALLGTAVVQLPASIINRVVGTAAAPDTIRVTILSPNGTISLSTPALKHIETLTYTTGIRYSTPTKYYLNYSASSSISIYSDADIATLDAIALLDPSTLPDVNKTYHVLAVFNIEEHLVRVNSSPPTGIAEVSSTPEQPDATILAYAFSFIVYREVPVVTDAWINATIVSYPVDAIDPNTVLSHVNNTPTTAVMLDQPTLCGTLQHGYVLSYRYDTGAVSVCMAATDSRIYYGLLYPPAGGSQKTLFTPYLTAVLGECTLVKSGKPIVEHPEPGVYIVRNAVCLVTGRIPVYVGLPALLPIVKYSSETYAFIGYVPRVTCYYGYVAFCRKAAIIDPGLPQLLYATLLDRQAANALLEYYLIPALVLEPSSVTDLDWLSYIYPTPTLRAYETSYRVSSETVRVAMITDGVNLRVVNVGPLPDLQNGLVYIEGLYNFTPPGVGMAILQEYYGLGGATWETRYPYVYLTGYPVDAWAWPVTLTVRMGPSISRLMGLPSS